jgi:5,10-methylenetetrahydromethanopterin reductase
VTITGNLDTCIERLKAIAALDIDRISFALLSGGRERRLEELATKVIPAVRAG